MLVQESSGTAAARSLLELRNNGPIGFNMVNTSGNTWRFAAQTTGFRIALTSATVPYFEVLNNGDAVLAGTLTENSDVNVKSDIELLDGDVVLAVDDNPLGVESLTLVEAGGDLPIRITDVRVTRDGDLRLDGDLSIGLLG